MRPVPFLLKSVLQLYAMQEEKARADLGCAVQGCAYVAGMLADAHQKLESDTRMYSEKRGHTFSARLHADHCAVLQARQACCKVLEERLALATDAEAWMRGVLVEARRRHQMLLKLHARHAEQQRRAELHHEELALADSYHPRGRRPA